MAGAAQVRGMRITSAGGLDSQTPRAATSKKRMPCLAGFHGCAQRVRDTKKEVLDIYKVACTIASGFGWFKAGEGLFGNSLAPRSGGIGGVGLVTEEEFGGGQVVVLLGKQMEDLDGVGPVELDLLDAAANIFEQFGQ